MVVVGGITRLTESGLSITEWKPVTGALPPFGEAAWLAEFEKYKQIPEYLEINGPAGMTLADYKNNLFLGMVPPAVRATYWDCLRAAIALVCGEARNPQRLWFAARRTVDSRRIARSDRMVDGQFRFNRTHRCQPLPAGSAFNIGADDIGGAYLDGS